MSQQPHKPVGESESRGYSPDAFQFVREALDYTVLAVHARDDASPRGKHVTGRQLCVGLRDYAIQQYGRMARTVLARWNITRTEDIGRIVYAMIDAGLLSKSEEDSLSDFEGAYDFADAFGDVPVL